MDHATFNNIIKFISQMKTATRLRTNLSPFLCRSLRRVESLKSACVCLLARAFVCAAAAGASSLVFAFVVKWSIMSTNRGLSLMLSELRSSSSAKNEAHNDVEFWTQTWKEALKANVQRLLLRNARILSMATDFLPLKHDHLCSVDFNPLSSERFRWKLSHITRSFNDLAYLSCQNKILTLVCSQKLIWKKNTMVLNIITVQNT